MRVHAAQCLGGDILELQGAYGFGNTAVDGASALGNLAHAFAQRGVDGGNVFQH
ncbi:hypothetical protein D3C77_799810 [compost metagenome]